MGPKYSTGDKIKYNGSMWVVQDVSLFRAPPVVIYTLKDLTGERILLGVAESSIESAPTMIRPYDGEEVHESTGIPIKDYVEFTGKIGDTL